MQVGDVFKTAGLPSLPPTIYGGFANLAGIGAAASKAKAANVLKQAGYEVQKDAAGTPTVVDSKGGNIAVKRAVDKVLNMKPSAALLAGGLLGATPMAIGLLRKAMSGGAQKGDIDLYGEPYSEISTAYGDNAAQAWLHGDVESLVGEIVDLASGDYSTGDQELDNAISSAVMEEAGDVFDTLGPEIGGLFTRARINAARKSAARRTRRSYKKASKQNLKNTKRRQLEAARQAKWQAGLMPESQMESYQGGGEDEFVPEDDFGGGEDFSGGGDDWGGQFDPGAGDIAGDLPFGDAGFGQPDNDE